MSTRRGSEELGMIAPFRPGACATRLQKPETGPDPADSPSVLSLISPSLPKQLGMVSPELPRNRFLIPYLSDGNQ